MQEDESIIFLKKQLASLFTELNAVEYGDFTLHSGMKSKYKIDAEKVLRDPIGRDIAGRVGRYVLDSIRNSGNAKKDLAIAGVSNGGSMFAATVANGNMYLDVNYKEGTIDGERENKPYAIFEDVSTTADSILKCKQLMEKERLRVTHAVVMVLRSSQATDNIINNKMKPKWVLHRSDLGIDESGNRI